MLDWINRIVPALLLTNPNTLGIFVENVLAIPRLVHQARGLCYYDAANLNAVLGIVRPVHMGFALIHPQQHKPIATPPGPRRPDPRPQATQPV